MSRRISLVAVVALFLLSPPRLLAGGPPWLRLPIDGVTPENAAAAADLLTSKLENKLIPETEYYYRGIRMSQDSEQWYLTFYIGEDVRLSEVEAALKGSGFTVPRDRLRLFGHVILEIDAGKTPTKELLADLEALDYVSVAASESKKDRLLVTVDMPYPMEDGRAQRESIGWDKFQRNDLASDQSTRSEPPATSRMLPSYDAFRDIVAEHQATLKDIRWSTEYACRPVGSVAVADPDAAISATQSPRSALKGSN